MSEVDARFIKRGIWTNLDQGNIMGKTITTDSTTGAIVIALMAVLSTMGTSHLWSIILFLYHQMRAHGKPTDGLFRQQQVLLRTLLPPTSLMAESTKLWWCWRNRNERVLPRSLIQFLMAASCTIGFIAASIASSFIVTSSDLEVLVQSPLCGSINMSLPGDVSRGYVSAVSAVSTPYADECYQNLTLLSARCKAYARPRIPFKTEKASCPFDLKFCIANTSTTSSIVAIDSGLVDVNIGFGLNLPKSDRIKYRRRTTCAVLPLEGHTSLLNASEFPEALQIRQSVSGEQLLLVHYGERPPIGEWKNTTMFVSLYQGKYCRGFSTLGAHYLPSLNEDEVGNDFLPFAGMRRDDADLTVKFLSSAVQFVHPVEDPWFLANQPKTTYDVGAGENTTSYLPNNPIAGIGCTTQHQFCITTSSGEHCSKLNYLPLDIAPKDWEGASPLQLSALKLVVRSNRYVSLISSNTLKASTFVGTGGIVRAQMSSDHWITEVQRMEAFVWASSQVSISDYVIGPSIRFPGVTDYVIKPETLGDKLLCGSLKMRKAGGFVNINVFGMSFVIATALFFAIVDIVLLKFLVYLARFRRALSPRIDRWIQDGVLQLQRRAYEAHNEGTWTGLNQEVPLTEAKELLAQLPLASLPAANSSAISSLPNAPQSNPAAPTHSPQTPTLTSQPSLPGTSPSQPPLTQPASPQSTPPLPTAQQTPPLQASLPQSPLPQSPLPQNTVPQPTPPQHTQSHPVSPSPANQGANAHP